MSRKLFAFLLSELVCVRLVCQNQHCKSVTELSLDKLRQFGAECPVCRADFVRTPMTGTNALNRLATAVLELQSAAEVSIEFILPDENK